MAILRTKSFVCWFIAEDGERKNGSLEVYSTFVSYRIESQQFLSISEPMKKNGFSFYRAEAIDFPEVVTHAIGFSPRSQYVGVSPVF